jgi:V8-like Glu-specific endopeptidase
VIGVGALVPLAAATGCGGYDSFADVDGGPEDLGSITAANICGTNDLQDVEQYVDIEGVPVDFVLEHQSPVGYYGCSGTLIGDGLMITAAHCISAGSVGTRVRFHYQMDADGNAREEESFYIAQIVENNPGGVTTDHALVRLFHNPENRFGFTTISSAGPAVGDPIVAIGHPVLPGPNYKKVDVGSPNSVTGTDMRYRSIDTKGGSSGMGLLGFPSGQLVGVHRSSTGCSGDVGNRGSTIERIFGVSEYVQRGQASARLLEPSDTGLAKQHWIGKGWPSGYRHIVPGVFKPAVPLAPVQQLFLYDSETGTGEFNEVSKNGTTLLGTVHTGLRKTLTQVVPVQIDQTSQQELLFYDAQAGLGSFYRTDGAGSLSLIRNISSWGKTWRHIVAGNFNSRAGQELLFYDPVGELMRLYGTNSNGTITLIKIIPGIAPDYSIIVPGEFSSASSNAEVLMYDPVNDQVAFLSFDDAGNATEFGRVESFGTSLFTDVAVGDFTSAPGTEVVFFEPSPTDVYSQALTPTGSAYYYSVEDGALTPTLVEQGHRRAHSRWVAGSFTSKFVPACDGCSFGTRQLETSVLLYDRYRN